MAKVSVGSIPRKTASNGKTQPTKYTIRASQSIIIRHVLTNKRKQSVDYISNKPQQNIDSSMKRAMLEAKNSYLSKTAIPLYIYAIIGIAMALCELQFPIANPMLHLTYLIIVI
jgi:hypothetical protein